MIKIIETIDNIPNDTLIQVIRNPNNFTWNFFAMKIILTRLNLKLKMNDKDKSIMSECCNELKSLLKKSIAVPNSQADLKQILSISKS